MVGHEKYQEILEKYAKGQNPRPLLIIGDPDVDGLFTLKYLNDFANFLGYTSYSYYVNDDRQHGFFLPLDKLKGYLVLTGDFNMTRAEIQALVDNDTVILATDHHELEDGEDNFILCSDSDGNEKGLLICNQYPFEPEENKYLSGAGVLYELICDIYPEFKTPERDALVGITLLSDVCPIEGNPRAEAYLRCTYGADVTHGYLKHLVEDANEAGKPSFGAPRLDNNFINFSLSPLLNSLLRFDKKQDAIQYVLGNPINTQYTRSAQKVLVSIMRDVADVMDFPNLHILAISYERVIAQFPDAKPQNFIGLACTSYMNDHGYVSTLGFVRKHDGTILRTSFRGKFSDVNYYRGMLGLNLDCKGHSTAFGIKEFNPDASTFGDMACLVADLEADHSETFTIKPVSNLALALSKSGMDIASANCYVRDAYRTYYRYTGNSVVERRRTYKYREVTPEEIRNGVRPDTAKNGEPIIWIRDESGNLIPKYIEYEIDGRLVKSFGIPYSENTLILPLLESGYMNLYLKEVI